MPAIVGRTVAKGALSSASDAVSDGNRDLLMDALQQIDRIPGTPIFNSLSYSDYQTRESVMLVKEEGETLMSKETATLPTPHLDKLKTLLENRRLPATDKPRVEAALQRYWEWIADLEAVKGGQRGAVQLLVDVTNRYKLSVELELIFDSPGEFLYRQKGQLKLDNTILEEFLPQLLYRGLNLAEGTFELGPRKTFAGLSFGSSIASLGTGADPVSAPKTRILSWASAST